MLDDGRIVDLIGLLEQESDWFDLVIPDSAPSVRLVRLHVDPTTKASVSLVAFPAGWRRPGVGHYVSGEEFFVLQGSLTVSGQDYLPGSWAWIPPYASRSDSCADSGALALAWFSGPAYWLSSAGDATATSESASSLPPSGPLRRRGPGVPGCSEALATGPTEPAAMDRELLSLHEFRWAFTPAHRKPPAIVGPVVLRHWS